MTQSCLHFAKGSGLFFPQPTSSNRAQSDSGFSEQLLSCGFRTNELSAQPVDQSVTQSQNCILLDLFYTRERERTIVVNFFFLKISLPCLVLTVSPSFYLHFVQYFSYHGSYHILVLNNVRVLYVVYIWLVRSLFCT